MEFKEIIKEDRPRRYRVRDISGRIKSALLEMSELKVWIQAHLITQKGGPNRGGHYYCELIDVDEDRGGAQVAKMRAVIWAGRLSAIKAKLAAAGCEDALLGNKEVCILGAIRFHDLYGISIEIFDVDTSFSEAAIDKSRRLILEALAKDGILKKNSGCPIPKAPLTIGLITSRGSAAYHDFCRTIMASPYSFRIIFAHSAVQGDGSAQEIARRVPILVDVGAQVICIVRGGGSEMDLHWLDNEDLARTVCHCPVPVFAGIGHEINAGILDQCSAMSFKTPTAVAEWIVGRISTLDDALQIASDRLRGITERRLALAAKGLDQASRHAISGFRAALGTVVANFKASVVRAKSSISSSVQKRAHTLETIQIQLRDRAYGTVRTKNERLISALKRFTLPRVLRILTEREKSLKEKNVLLTALGLDSALRRGFSVSRDTQGNVIRSVTELAVGDVIVTQFADGVAVSTIDNFKGE